MLCLSSHWNRDATPINQGSVALDPAQVSALAAMPMSCMDLDKYLEKAEPDRTVTMRDFDADFPLAE